MSDALDFLDSREEARIQLPVDDVFFWLDYIEQYLKAIEGFFRSEPAAIRERYKDIGPDLVAGGHLEALEDFFPDILRKSIFVAAYALAEKELDQRCGLLERKLGLTLHLGDLSGKGMLRAKKYLAKVAGLQFRDPLISHWDELNNYRRLRNSIVHSGAQLRPGDGDDEHLRTQYIPKHQEIRLLSNGEFSLDQGFCEQAVKTVRLFFQELDRAQRSASQTT